MAFDPERNHVPGLPRLIKGEKTKMTVSAHVTRDEAESLQKEAFANGMTLSDFVRTKLGLPRNAARLMMNPDGPGGISP